MKEQKCSACQTINEIEYTIRPGNTGPITIRCKMCKKLMLIHPAKVANKTI